MVKEEKFLLLSLEEDKAKELANAISNETARKILNFLSEKEASEHKIAQNLNLPASTVHYNTQQLLKSNLIEVKDFYWSEKGNKINVYKVANKLIIIAPKTAQTNKFKINIKRILPIALLSLIASGVIYIITKGQILAAKTTQYTIQQGDKLARTTAIPAATQEAAEEAIKQTAIQPNIALWFFLGGLFAVISYLIINLIRKK